MGRRNLLKGTIYSGINNIYDVREADGTGHECRIKGKILKEDRDSYNPFAPGDQVDFEISDQGKGLILSRLPRRNRFARWNRKRESWQIVAANIDLLIAVISSKNPPFRPRFVDRVLIAAAQGNVNAAILVNKIDQGVDSWVSERIAVWESIGITVLKSSADSGEGLDKLQQFIADKTAVMFGPSGVGKSTLLNHLVPGLEQTTGEISVKHDRGRHVTNFGRLIDAPWGGRLVDTPGVREILVRGIDPNDLSHWFPEFKGVESGCAFSPCSHRHEPECGVLKAVEDGIIHPDRYENYLRIRDELEVESRW
jgi:ribosome biogenesis GTPase